MVVVRLAVIRFLQLRVVMVVQVGCGMPGHHRGLVAMIMVSVLVAMFVRVVVTVCVSMYMRMNEVSVLVFVGMKMRMCMPVKMPVKMAVCLAMVVVDRHRSVLVCVCCPRILPQDRAARFSCEPTPERSC